MNLFFYNSGIFFYWLLVKIVSPFNQKAKLFLQGRCNIFEKIEEKILLNKEEKELVWFHCASLGEFEQARPVIEGFKEQHPDDFIFVTFFSPSGYEIRKNYEQADAVFYLPLDTKTNAEKLISIIKPKVVYFVKYDFWYHYLKTLKEKQVPVILFSAIFRNNQHFFKFYGGFYRRILSCFSHIFVQNESSAKLLQTIGLANVTVAGDTRFDRVKQTVDQKREIPLAGKFKNGEKTIVIGSCWNEDLQVLIPFVNQFHDKLKVIIAPHEIKESVLQEMEKELVKKTVRFSKINDENAAEFDILLIDNIGMLSSLYAYGEFAYVGGGFRQGLHNILEPATFGIPVFWGSETDRDKYPEAFDLIAEGGGFSVKSTQEFSDVFLKLYSDEVLRRSVSQFSQNFIIKNIGATKKILTF